MKEINPDNTVFAILCFEGPDLYASAGGLSVRISELARALAEEGYTTHLFFVGDPHKPAEEKLVNDKFILHRWCQWISHYHMAGVYQAEDEKLWDYERSLPPYLIENVIKPAVSQKKLVVILGEEWHTTSTVINLHEMLKSSGLRDKVLMFWNANNVFSFWRINWGKLQEASTITTISRYMKHYMWDMGLDPLVIPNGIPSRLLEKVNLLRVKKLRSIWEGETMLVKVGRYDPDKRWVMAIEAVAELKKQKMKPHMLMRGGMEAHRADVMARAKDLGLSIYELSVTHPSFETIIEALQNVKNHDLIELRFFVPEDFLRLMYAAADAVLANSGREPFGLVGLEVMATGGIAFTGNTGEDYAQSFSNAVVLDTDDAREIATYLEALEAHPEEKERLRENARATAGSYVWQEVIKELLRKIEFNIMIKGIKIKK
ncbi:MAG: glycosyltransferase [Firmicutes bacterium]|nr:glycosyltransferase [Bacillota bacterium]